MFFGIERNRFTKVLQSNCVANRKPRILIAGVGNELRKDDGFGPAVIRELNAASAGSMLEADIIDFGQRLYDILLRMKEYEVVIIVDAVEGEGKPGDIYIVRPEDLCKTGTKSLELHNADLKELIALAEGIGCLPEDIYVIGCHPEDVSWGVGLTPAVAEKIRVVVDLIHKIIRNYV